jgi:hypothetical protein
MIIPILQQLSKAIDHNYQDIDDFDGMACSIEAHCSGLRYNVDFYETNFNRVEVTVSCSENVPTDGKLRYFPAHLSDHLREAIANGVRCLYLDRKSELAEAKKNEIDMSEEIGLTEYEYNNCQ